MVHLFLCISSITATASPTTTTTSSPPTWTASSVWLIVRHVVSNTGHPTWSLMSASNACGLSQSVHGKFLKYYLLYLHVNVLLWRCGKGDWMVYCVRIKEGSWYELVECDHCDTTTLEDDVFYSDTESSDSSIPIQHSVLMRRWPKAIWARSSVSEAAGRKASPVCFLFDLCRCSRPPPPCWKRLLANFKCLFCKVS